MREIRSNIHTIFKEGQKRLLRVVVVIFLVTLIDFLFFYTKTIGKQVSIDFLRSFIRTSCFGCTFSVYNFLS